MHDQKPTPTPWYAERDHCDGAKTYIPIARGSVWENDYASIAEVVTDGLDANGEKSFQIAEANAHFIVRACNNFEPLTNAIERFLTVGDLPEPEQANAHYEALLGLREALEAARQEAA